MDFTISILFVVLFFGVVLLSHQPALAETSEQRDQRLAWWREARFGLFIHWGLFSLPMEDPKGMDGYFSLPLDEFLALKERFNPTRFDPDEWVRLAKAAGMKYMIVVTKSHDGWCLFDSEYTDFDVRSTPFQRDVLKELAEACRRGGLKLGWYYSILDWHHPDYLPRRAMDPRPTTGADFDRYVTYLKNQLRELLTNYGPIDVLWFDGEWDDTWTPERGQDLYRYVRRLQPDILINNRVDKGRRDMLGLTVPGGYAGDFGTPEQTIPPTAQPGVDWEACMTLNDHWQYMAYDQNWKSAPTLIRLLVDCASKGGNFLLDVGPEPDGPFPPPAIDRLEGIGRWMRVNGESIYGTQAGLWTEPLPWGRGTTKQRPDGQTRLYLHVFDWPSEGCLVVPGLRQEVRTASLLADENRTALPVSRDGETVRIAVPLKPPDEAVSVVMLDL